jgi:hypothetical protein
MKRELPRNFAHIRTAPAVPSKGSSPPYSIALRVGRGIIQEHDA